jgi:hypothetical protein
MIDNSPAIYPIKFVTEEQALRFIQLYTTPTASGHYLKFAQIAQKMELLPIQVYHTIRQNETLKALYERAREERKLMRADDIVEETIEIADTEDNAAKGRNRIQTRQWAASRWDNVSYGDKVQVDQRTVEVTVELPAFSKHT